MHNIIVVIINFPYRVYVDREVPSFCYVEVKYYGLEFDQTSFSSSMVNWIWIYFPICLSLVYLAFRRMIQEKGFRRLRREPQPWQVRTYNIMRVV